MGTMLKIEELFMFFFGIYLFNQLPFQWWWFLILIFTPDIGMLGYLFGNRAGALIYNAFHHKGLAIAAYLLGIYLSSTIVMLTGIILFSHAAMDRVMGYGLKYNKGFKFTHLGEIGKHNE